MEKSSLTIKHVATDVMDEVWPQVYPHLQAALTDCDELDVSQLKLLIRQRQVTLLTFCRPDNSVALACALEFQEFPNYRVAHVVALGGAGVRQATQDTWAVLRDWLRHVKGCRYMQAWCKDAQARLFAREVGMTKSYNVMRVEL